MTDHKHNSLVAAAMHEIGAARDNRYYIEALEPPALDPTSDILTKRFIFLLVAARFQMEKGEIDRRGLLEDILTAMAKQDPKEAFIVLFDAYDVSADNYVGEKKRPEDFDRIPKDAFVYKNAISLLPLLPAKDLPLCAAYVFDDVVHSYSKEPVLNLVKLVQGMLYQLDRHYPEESGRLRQHVKEHLEEKRMHPLNPQLSKALGLNNTGPGSEDLPPT